MYHQVSSGSWGKAKDVEERIIETKRLQKMLEQHTLEHTGIPKRRLKEVYKTKFDWYMTAKEALELKVVDKILD